MKKFKSIDEFIKDKVQFTNYSTYCELSKTLHDSKHEYVEIFTLNKKINSNNIVTGMGFNKGPIFNISEEGYFVFINPCTLANWGHECFYLFLTKNKLLIETEQWAPENIENMQKFTF